MHAACIVAELVEDERQVGCPLAIDPSVAPAEGSKGMQTIASDNAHKLITSLLWKHVHRRMHIACMLRSIHRPSCTTCTCTQKTRKSKRTSNLKQPTNHVTQRRYLSHLDPAQPTEPSPLHLKEEGRAGKMATLRLVLLGICTPSLCVEMFSAASINP